MNHDGKEPTEVYLVDLETGEEVIELNLIHINDTREVSMGIKSSDLIKDY